MPIGVSCLLHLGLAVGLVLGQQWVQVLRTTAPPVLPIQLVTLDAIERAREMEPPPRAERVRPARPLEPTRPEPSPAPTPAPQAKIDEPATQPAAPIPAEIAPAPIAAGLPAVSEPAIVPAPAASTPAAAPAMPSALPPAALVAKGPSAPADGITRTARPQGGYQVRPAYPATPRRLGIQGTTLLRVHVLADGRIGDVLVERSAGHPDLDEAASQAVRRWRFEPARRGEDAVSMWVLLPVEFRLAQ